MSIYDERRKPVIEVKPRLLSKREAAAYLNMSERTLERKAIAGEIPVVKSGRRWMFDKADLDRYVEANKKMLAC